MKIKKVKQVITPEQFVNAFYRDLARIKAAIDENEDWFKNLWEAGADEYEFLELAKVVYQKAYGGVPSTDDKFHEGWQFRTVLNENYNQAKHEFANLIIGWW